MVNLAIFVIDEFSNLLLCHKGRYACAHNRTQDNCKFLEFVLFYRIHCTIFLDSVVQSKEYEDS